MAPDQCEKLQQQECAPMKILCQPNHDSLYSPTPYYHRVSVRILPVHNQDIILDKSPKIGIQTRMEQYRNNYNRKTIVHCCFYK